MMISPKGYGLYRSGIGPRYTMQNEVRLFSQLFSQKLVASEPLDRISQKPT